MPYHRAILAAIREDGPERASAAMVDHLELARLLDPGVTLEALLVVAPDGADHGPR